jgi:hypothetical protein
LQLRLLTFAKEGKADEKLEVEVEEEEEEVEEIGERQITPGKADESSALSIPW